LRGPFLLKSRTNGPTMQLLRCRTSGERRTREA
jgi:hypothetical protein